MSHPGFPGDGSATTHLVHNLVEEAVRSLEGVPIPLTREYHPGPKEKREPIVEHPANRIVGNPARTPPNQWPVEEISTREALRHSISPSKVRELLDFSALLYADEPDDNLLCPICKLPVITPIITPCDHTFCLECLKRHFRSSDTCPIDRTRFRARDCKTSRLLTNILDSLVVECPNTERGCSEKMKREEVVKHTINCRYTLHDCPDKACDKRVQQWLAVSGKCWHFEQTCEYCEDKMEAASMADHINKKCTKNTTSCSDCGVTIKLSA
ncbi:TRAF-type zinc finger protein, partial [Colletotrichum higginsianum]